MSYRDMVTMSGMPWSKMLKEASVTEIRHFSGHSSTMRCSLYTSSHPGTDLPKVAGKKQAYHWTRTEDLEPKIQATDRPYRNTYGDGTTSPSKLYLSTELPELNENCSPSSTLDSQKLGFEAKKWGSSKHISRIYKMLHTGDSKELSKLHVYKRRGRNDKHLPLVLPHFYIQLNESIKQVLKQEEIPVDDEVPVKRPLTSERITYKPITKRSCNPELKISKTGTVEFRFAKLVKPNAHVTNSTNPGRINVTEVNISPPVNLQPKHSRPLQKILNRKILKPEREQLKKMTTPTNSLSIPQPKPVVSTTSQSAEGFPLTVKITSKTNSAAITPDL